eukprot:TRINITY_DN6906_c0_g1_i8.p1 TRINITY_DN6906_c0_g1~~TRINITY_DN6906_c0_g1_i8.p1  ORF type:complete len:739 (-),score=149.18 TRINITY_DN6906_c0_g1_i8:143-2359(-)
MQPTDQGDGSPVPSLQSIMKKAIKPPAASSSEDKRGGQGSGFAPWSAEFTPSAQAGAFFPPDRPYIMHMGQMPMPQYMGTPNQFGFREGPTLPRSAGTMPPYGPAGGAGDEHHHMRYPGAPVFPNPHDERFSSFAPSPSHSPTPSPLPSPAASPSRNVQQQQQNTHFGYYPPEMGNSLSRLKALGIEDNGGAPERPPTNAPAPATLTSRLRSNSMEFVSAAANNAPTTAPVPGQAANPVSSTHGGTTYFYPPGSSGPAPPGLPRGPGPGRGANPNPVPAPSPLSTPPSNYVYNPYLTVTQPPPSRKPGFRSAQSLFMSETLRQELFDKRVASLSSLDPDDPRANEIPPVLHRYHTLMPLDEDPPRERPFKVFGYPTWVYRATSSTDGQQYCVRRLGGFRLQNEFALGATESWRAVAHPSIVPLREIFLSKEFGDGNSLYFVYDYFPLSETLESKYLGSGPGAVGYVPEPVLWSVVCQLVLALRVVHGAGLAMRVVHPSKIIVTSRNRVRINGAGIFDVIDFNPTKSVAQHQHEDLLALGRLIVTLACRSPMAVQNLVKSVDYLGQHYSQDLKALVVYLLTKPTVHYPSVEEIVTRIAPRIATEAENLLSYADSLSEDLSKEVENGRIVRLLSKLGFINERPEYALEPRWSETGDRYLLKLFRSHVFHQEYSDGQAVVDLGYVIECLNKLDVGVDEKIPLISRDEQSMLVVSYKDLKRCLELSFHELLSKKPYASQQSS